MSSLIQLIDTASALERALVQSGGEVTPDIEKMLEVTDVQLPEKVDSYALVIDRMDSIERFYKTKAEMYLSLAKSAANVSSRCEANLKTAMQALGTTEIEGFDIRYVLVNSNPACVIEDESLIDGAYKITETVTKVDKKRLAEDLKLGVPVPGAKLERGQSLRRYLNTPNKKAVSK